MQQPLLARSLRSASSFLPLFRNAHLQTILSNYWPAKFDPKHSPTEAHLFRTEPEVQVLAHINRHHTQPSGMMLILHGLTGSSISGYVLNMARSAFEAGFDVIRLNVRNCGGTEHLCPTLYHSGLTTDLRSIVDQLPAANLYLVGFSMGGNVILKLAGEWGSKSPPGLRAICAVSVPLDLARCASRLGETQNRIYEIRFLHHLQKTVEKKEKLMPGTLKTKSFSNIDSIIDFDDSYTAPAFGFQDARDYYEQCSSTRFLPAIQVPTLVVQAQDDPIIPFAVFHHPAFQENPNLHLLSPAHGGHVGFISRRKPRFWVAEPILGFCRSLA